MSFGFKNLLHSFQTTMIGKFGVMDYIFVRLDNLFLVALSETQHHKYLVTFLKERKREYLYKNFKIVFNKPKCRKLATKKTNFIKVT